MPSAGLALAAAASLVAAFAALLGERTLQRPVRRKCLADLCRPAG